MMTTGEKYNDLHQNEKEKEKESKKAAAQEMENLKGKRLHTVENSTKMMKDCFIQTETFVLKCYAMLWG